MEDWVHRALQRWPNVPALFGWLALDRRGRWLIRGEPITRPQIIETIDRNYGVDEHGRWYFQNGPQRGYMKLEVAPFVLHVSGDGAALLTHTGLPVTAPTQAFLDEEGSILIVTEHGPALLADQELAWALERLRAQGAPVGEEALAAALAVPSGQSTELELALGEHVLRVQRLDRAQMPAALGYVLDPQARDGERATSGDAPV